MALFGKKKTEGSLLISPLSGLALSINTAIGSGILALPLSFQQSGIILSSVIIYFFGVLMWTTCIQYLEIACRYWHKTRPDHEYTLPEDDIVHLGASVLETPTTRAKSLICYTLYQIGLILMQFVTIMAYANVSAGSMAQVVHFPMQDGDACLNTSDLSKGCSHAYMIWVTVYIVINLVMSFIELKYQAILQNLFALYRWVLIIVLIGMSSYALKHRGVSDSAIKYETTPAGFGSLLPTLTFAMYVHSGISYLYQPVRNKNKSLNLMFFSLMMIVSVVFCLVACLNALAYGNSLSSVVTSSYLSDPLFTTKFEKGLIQLINWYPPLALTFSSCNQAFPFAQSLIEFAPKRYSNSFWLKISARWIVIIIPSVIVYGVRSFTVLVSLSAFGGYLVCFFVPSLTLLLTADLKSAQSPYYKWYCQPWYCYTIILWAIFSVIYTAIFFS